MRKLLLLAQVGLIVLTLMSYLSAVTSPASTWLFYFFGLAYPILLIFNLLFIAFWIWRKRRYWIYSLITLLIGWGNMTKFFGLALFSSESKKQNLTILTYNTEGFDYLTRDKTQIANRVVALNSFLTENAPDIVCLQEHCLIEACVKEQKEKFPYIANFYSAHTNMKALVIFSKFPIVNSGCLNLEKGTNDAIFADINVNGTLTRVYSAHLKSNSVSVRTNELIKNKELDREAASTSKSVLSTVKRMYSVRATMAEALKKHIKQSPYPVIVCGDFNDTPQTYTYNVIAENLQDTWQAKGFGRGTTYAGSLPFLRIDYVLVDDNFDVLDCYVRRNAPFSDHYPVVAKVAVR